MIFVSHNESSEVEEPCDGSFDDPSFSVTPEWATVLSCFPFSSSAMGTDEFDVSSGESFAKPVGIGRAIVNDSPGHPFRDTDVDKCFDRIHFSKVGGQRENGQRGSASINHQHDLCALATLRFANIKTPFFAGENVPSPIASDQCSSFRRSMRSSSRFHASSHTPDSVQSRWRRQHVEELGYRSGKSCQRAPFFNTQMMPSKQARGVTRGRPPIAVGGGSGNKSLIIAHWASVTKGFGAVLDPVVFGRRRGGHFDREMTIVNVSFHQETYANTLPIKH